MGKRGGAGTVYADKPAQERADGTVVKSFQRMPTQLLQEWAQREKRPRPQFYTVRPWERGKFRQKVYLQDPKKQEASLEFEAANDSGTLFEAKEHAAMVALLKVQGSFPLERKLPDAYAELWKASVAAAAAEAKKFDPKSRAKAAAKASGAPAVSPAQSSSEAGAAPDTSPTMSQPDGSDGVSGGDARTVQPLWAMNRFTSKAEKVAADHDRRRQRNKREAERENRRRANLNAPIILSQRMRKALYSALGLGQAMASSLSGDDAELDDDINEDEATALSCCEDWGFALSDAQSALMAFRESNEDPGSEGLAEWMRTWLCLHMPEDELPEQFAAGRGQFEVFKAGARKEPRGGGSSSSAPKKSADELALNALLDWLRKELASRLDEADADGIYSGVEAVLRGVDLSEEEEAQEAGENAVAVLSSEQKAECLGAQLEEHWKAVLEAFKAALAAESTASASVAASSGEAKKAAAVAAQEEEEEADGCSDVASTVASAADLKNADGFWEETCGIRDVASNEKSTSAASASSSSASKRCWFGGRGPSAALAAFESWSSGAPGQRMRKHRDGLPSAKSREELLRLVQSSQVVLVQGETGCGKTTQVGQFLIEANREARVVVTQPRRVAAVSVAQRVAEERGERMGQGAVGYSVRGESQLHREHCRLLFCTNGILLRRLLGQPEDMFSDRTCTHLVIDEVHERSVEIDLLLTLIGHKLKERPNLRVLLMSATMDVEQLSGMFAKKPPVVKIPGRTFPVTQLYLEDAEDQLGLFSKLPGDDDDGGPDNGFAERRGGGGKGGAHQPQGRLAFIDFGMLTNLVMIAARGEFKEGPKEGAILVFLPGVGEISRLVNELQRASGRDGNPKLMPLPLHGGLPPDQQRRCFEVPPKGAPRKVVVSTNVAETSVTVPDVTVVIDTARERRLCLDPGAVAPCLAERLCAQSSLRQRKGRAGRVQAGLCLTMLPRRQAQALPMESPPEIESAPLETLCLQVRVAGFLPDRFLARSPTPPEPRRVAAAERMLLKIGATRSAPASAGGVEVAALGRHLAALPCDVHTGKLLVIGAFLGIASCAVDSAAMLSVRSPLKSTQRDPDAESFRTELRNQLRPGGGKSDHCLAVALMQQWTDHRTAWKRRELCQKAGLAYERMAEASSVRSQLLAGLRGLGFAPGTGGEDDRRGADWRALRAAVCAAFYPQIARVDRPPKEYIDTIGGAIEKQAEARRLRYFILTDAASDATVDRDGGRGFQKHEDTTRAFLHPSSTLFKEASYSCPYVVFSAKQAQEAWGDKPSRVNLSDVSEVSVFALLLFGGRLQVDTQKNEVLVDSWIAFTGGSTTVVGLVEKLRKEIDALLMRKIERPSLSVGSTDVAQALGTLISTDGLG